MKTRIEGRCIWLREAISRDEEDCAGLQGNQTADVCIVGGGFAGMWTAFELKRRQPSLDVAIVEADICGGGPSGRNSGMVLSQWAKFRALQAFCGADGAIALGKSFGQSADDIAAFCQVHGIDAEFRRDGWIWGATCPRQVGSWNDIMAALDAHRVNPFRAITGEEIAAVTGSNSFLAGIYDPSAATVHPGKLVRGLRRVVLKLGVRLYENSLMTRLERTVPRVHTAAGSIKAGRVVLTMNAWSTRFPELRSAILVIASDDAMSAPAPELLERIGYKARPLMNDSQLFVTGFRTTSDHRFAPGITGGVIGFGGLGSNRFEGRSFREGAIRDSVRRGHPVLADLPFIDSWVGPIDRPRSGFPLFERPVCPPASHGSS